jgi:hypothetical protein
MHEKIGSAYQACRYTEQEWLLKAESIRANLVCKDKALALQLTRNHNGCVRKQYNDKYDKRHIASIQGRERCCDTYTMRNIRHN